MPMPTPVDDARVIEVSAPAVDPLADGSRAFGFDQPRPDYAALRAQRWKELQDASAQSAAVTPATDGVNSTQYSPE